MEQRLLRIVTPLVNKRGGPDYQDGILQTSETTAPITARKRFEEENREFERWGVPELKHRITEISIAPPQPARPAVAPAFQTDVKAAKPKKKRPKKIKYTVTPIPSTQNLDEDDFFK